MGDLIFSRKRNLADTGFALQINNHSLLSECCRLLNDLILIRNPE